MAISFRQFIKGILLKGETVDPSDNLAGSIWHNVTSGNLKTYLGAAVRELITADQTQTLTNKTIDGDLNTVSDLALTSLKTEAGDANKLLSRDGSGIVVSTISVPSGNITTDTSTQTLTNKTIDGDDNTIQDLALSSLKTILGDADKFIVRDVNGAVISANTVPTGTVVGTSDTQTLTNKTIDGDDNTITDLALTSLKTNIADATKFLVRDASGIVVSNTKAVPTGDVVGTSDTQNLSGKTFTDDTLFKTSIQLEDPGVGTNKITLQAPTLAGDYTFTLPVDDGAAGQVLKTDGAGVLSWVTNSASVSVEQAGTPVGSFNTLNFTNASISDAGGGQADITVSGGGGGGGGGSDPVRILLEAEASSTAEVEIPNEFIDDFEETDKGTLTNLTRNGSRASFSGSNLTGSIKRDAQAAVTQNSASVTGIINLQALAPKATTITVSSNNRTVKFDGDVRSYFPDTKKVIAVRKYLDSEINTDSKTLSLPLIDDTNGLIKFTVNGTPTFSSGETTVVLTSTETEDITFGLVAADYPTKLRFCPFNYAFKINTANASPTGGQYEEVTISEAFALDEVSITGASYFNQLTDAAITGTILKIDAQVSDNGLYGFMRVVENEGATEAFHFWYSKDSGSSWTYLGTKPAPGLYASTFTDEIGGQFEKLSNNMLVSNSGKVICPYLHFDSGNNIDTVRGIYTNLSDVTPTMNDMPAHVGTNSTNTATVMFGNTTYSLYVISAAQTIGDDSFISFLGFRQGTDAFQVKSWDFSGSAPTYLSSSDTGEVSGVMEFTSPGSTSAGCVVTGSGTSHRTHVFGLSTTGTALDGRYFNQGSATANSYTNIANLDCSAFLGWKSNGSYLVAIGSQSATGYPIYTYLDLTGTTWSSRFFLSPQNVFNTNNLLNWHTASARNNNKIALNRIVFDPVNGSGKSVLIAFDVESGATGDTAKSYLCEVRDITAYQGVHISQYSAPNSLSLRDNAAKTSIGQTFTANTSRFRSCGFKLKQSGIVSSSSVITCKIFATSAGIPTGAALYTSNNTVKASSINAAFNEWIFFNFDGVSLTNGVVYAMVLEADYSISSSNYLYFGSDNGVPYASGTAVSYDGSVWTTTATDLAFIVSGDWHEIVGNAEVGTSSNNNLYSNNMETQVAKIDNNQVRLTWGKNFKRYASSDDNPITGIPYTRTITWGTGNNQSALSNAIALGYKPEEFDENLVFNVSYGSDSSAGKDLTTGVLTTVSRNNDRSPLNMAIAVGSASSYPSDVDFQSGKCWDLNGSSEYFGYTDSNVFDLYYNKPFSFEIEIKSDTVAASPYCIFSHGDSGSVSYGYGLYIGDTSSGDLRFRVRNTSGTIIADAKTNSGFISASTYYVIKVWSLGNGTSPKIAKATSFSDMHSQTGSYTEATYAATTVFSSGNTASTDYFYVGRQQGGNYYDGKIGYIKFVNGSSTFAYSGYKENAPIVSTQNLGKLVVGKKLIGNTSTVINSSFNLLGIMNENTALVDSYPMVFKGSIEPASVGKYQHFLLDAERPVATDPSSIEGYVVSFSK